MGLDRPERTFRLAGDLLERELAEEAQDHDLAVGLRERGDGGPEVGGTLGADAIMDGSVVPVAAIAAARRRGRRLDPPCRRRRRRRVEPA